MGASPIADLVTVAADEDRTSTSLLLSSMAVHEPALRLHALSLTHRPALSGDAHPIDVSGLEVAGVRLVELLAAFDETELVALGVALALEQVVARTGAAAVYVAPSVEAIRPWLGHVTATEGRAASRLLVARRRSSRPPRDDKRPDPADLLDVAPVGGGLVVAHPGCVDVLRHLANAALATIRRGRHVTLAEHLAGLTAADDSVELIDAPFLLDGWNADERLAADVALVDFDGYDPTSAPHRALATVPNTRRPLLERPDLAAIYRERRARVRAQAEPDRPDAEPRRTGTPTAEIVSGVAFDETMRSCYRRALLDWLDGRGERPPYPFDDGARFLRWLGEPVHGGPVAISRYVDEIRRGRPDLLDAFPAIPGRSASDLLRWAIDHGRTEAGIPPALVPPAPPPLRPAGYLQPGVNLAGFLTAELGVGEVARRLALAMDTASVPFGTLSFDRTANRRALPSSDDVAQRFDTNIVCINPDSLGEFLQSVGPGFSSGRRRIGVWFWETADLPSMFHPAFGDVDEVWAASDFVADAIRAAAPPDLPVVRFPLPIVAPPVDESVDRAALGLPHDRVVFLFSFDYLSVAERKNPFGVAQAFREAFGPDEGPLLVVKSINGDKRPDDVERLRWVASGRSDIVLRDGYLDAAANAALIRCADCFVSLHRSEGFGFNMADAIALGVPVIASRYSGNLTFMRDEDTMLVDCGEVAVGPGRFPYLPESVWADPDLEQAGRFMREVCERPAEARERAAAAQRRVLDEFSPATTGRFIRDRLAAGRADRPTEPTPVPRADSALRTVVRRLRSTMESRPAGGP